MGRDRVEDVSAPRCAAREAAGAVVSATREKPVPSIPSACHGWAETVAAYRFLDNPAIGEQEILSGHHHATLDRIRAQEVVLRVQDTTCLNYGTTRQKPGMGTVKVKSREAYLLHPSVAFTPERVN